MVPPNTNRGPGFAEQPVRLGGRKPVASSCRDEVVVALEAFVARNGKQVFTAHEVYAEMQASGTAYAERTVLKTMQRMKEPPVRPPFVRLDRGGRAGFRLKGST